ncbi:MAG: hypothetical protein R3F43_04680 [bacterium]
MWELADGIVAEACPRRKKAGLARAGSGGGALCRPDDAAEGRQAQPSACRARHEGDQEAWRRTPRRAEGRCKVAHIAY